MAVNLDARFRHDMASYDEDLTTLEEWIRRLKVEYDIFFNGNRRKPPDDLRMRVEKLVKRFSEALDMSFSQRFRYNTLIARFYVYRDLWRRTQQELESSGEGRGATPASRPPRSETRQNSGFSEVQVSIADPAEETSKMRRLYDAVLHARGETAQNSSTISFGQFSAYITAQTEKMKKKHGCSSVTFRIARDEATIKLTAKAGDSLAG